jgi:hypothetical protein
MSAKPQPKGERTRCPHDNKLLDKTGKCWACGKSPDEWEVPKEVNSIIEKPDYELDTDTGELHPGQLLLGIDVPVLTQRKGQSLGMNREDAANALLAAVATMREGDRVSAAMKDGGIVVKVTEGWRAE